MTSNNADIRRHGSDAYFGCPRFKMAAPCISARRQNWRNGAELEQFKAMDRLILK